MKTGDIVFLRRPYKGYRAVELMERLECRWLVRIVESGLELEVYEDELISAQLQISVTYFCSIGLYFLV